MEEAPKAENSGNIAPVNGEGESHGGAPGPWSDAPGVTAETPTTEAGASALSATNDRVGNTLQSSYSLRQSALDSLSDTLERGLGAAFAQAFGEAAPQQSQQESAVVYTEPMETPPSAAHDLTEGNDRTERNGRVHDAPQLEAKLPPNQSRFTGLLELMSRKLDTIHSSGRDLLDTTLNLFDQLSGSFSEGIRSFGIWIGNIVVFIKHQVERVVDFCKRFLEAIGKRPEKSSAGSDKSSESSDRSRFEDLSEIHSVKGVKQSDAPDGEVELPLHLIGGRRKEDNRVEQERAILFDLGERAEEAKREEAEREVQEDVLDAERRSDQVNIVNVLAPELQPSEILEYYAAGGEFVEGKSIEQLIQLASLEED